MAFTEDFSAFFDTDDFAVSALLTPAVGVPVTLTGIFDAEYFEIEGDGVGIEGAQPVFMCPSAEVTMAKYKDTLTIGSINYKIITIKPDGTGVTMLVLEKQ